MIRLVTFLLMLLPSLAVAQEKLVLGLSQDEVSITATFPGSELLIFGAISRETPPPQNSDLGVIIAVAGPNVPVTIRRKERVAGIWINTDSANIDIAPSFYAVATSGPLNEVLRPLEDLQHAITWDRVVRSAGQDAFPRLNFPKPLHASKKVATCSRCSKVLSRLRMIRCSIQPLRCHRT